MKIFEVFFGFLQKDSDCSIADVDKFITISRELLQKLVYKTSSCSEKIQFINLFCWKIEREN